MKGESNVQIKVEAVARQSKVFNKQTTWGVKLADGWITLYRDAPPSKGDVLDVNITSRQDRNDPEKIWRDAFPVMPPLAPPETISNNGAGPVATKPDDTWSNNSGKKVPWEGCIVFAKAAHELALELEPDELDPGDQGDSARIRTDKSVARAAILNTLMIAYTGGKILVPKDEADEYVPPAEDDIPPF
jgi:hypothetical protein